MATNCMDLQCVNCQHSYGIHSGYTQCIGRNNTCSCTQFEEDGTLVERILITRNGYHLVKAPLSRKYKYTDGFRPLCENSVLYYKHEILELESCFINPQIVCRECMEKWWTSIETLRGMKELVDD